ncbi:MAG: hypothetical protein P8Z37_12815 [Acidobacteriota bacterium]
MSVQTIKTLTILKKTFGRFHAVFPRSVAGILLFMGLPMLTENMDLLKLSSLNLFAIILFISMFLLSRFYPLNFLTMFH